VSFTEDDVVDSDTVDGDVFQLPLDNSCIALHTFSAYRPKNRARWWYSGKHRCAVDRVSDWMELSTEVVHERDKRNPSTPDLNDVALVMEERVQFNIVIILNVESNRIGIGVVPELFRHFTPRK
jgi:hypothetical protein